MRLRYHTLVSLTSKDQNSIPIPTEAMDAFIKVLFDLLVKDSKPSLSGIAPESLWYNTPRTISH